jgi:hypothetical protein
VVETTRDIKYDTEQILMEIERLREQLPKNGHNNFMLERYLDQLTSYAETVVDGNESLGEAVPESPRIDPDLADASSAELDMPTFEHEEQDQATSFSHAAQDQAARQEGGLTTAMKQVKIRPVDERALLEGDENEEILARIRIADDHETDALAWETTSRPQLQFRSRKQAALSLSSQTRQPKLAGKRGSDENLRRAAQRDAPEEHIDTQAPAPDHTDETGDTSIQKVARSVSRELSSARNVPSPPPGGQVLPRPMESSKAQRSERQHYTSRQNDRIRELILIQETSTYREYYEGLQYSDISKTQFQAQAANVINSGFRFQYRTRSSLKLTVVLTSFPQEADKVVASRGTRLLSVPFYAEDPYKIVQSMHSELGLSVGEMMLVVHDHQSVAQHQESLNYIGFKHSLKPEALSTFLQVCNTLLWSRKRLESLRQDKQSTLRVHDKRRVNSHPREVLFLRICEHNFDPMKAHITETALAMSLKPRMTIHTHSLAAVLSHKKEIRQAFYDMIAQGVGMRGVYWLKPRMLGTHKLVRARHQGEQSGVPMF